MANLYDFPEIYDERFTENANQAYKQHYEKMLSGKSIRSILDCSFGTGNLTFPLLELGYEVSGSDISAPMLEKAAKKAREKGFDVPLVQCDFRELSGRFDRQFDCVMSTGSALGHVTEADVLKTIHEMDKLIIPGGWLYFDSRNWDAAKKNTDRFIVPQPFYKEDGTRIGCVQVWDYNADGTITINIVHSYETCFAARYFSLGFPCVKSCHGVPAVRLDIGGMYSFACYTAPPLSCGLSLSRKDDHVLYFRVEAFQGHDVMPLQFLRTGFLPGLCQ